MAGKPKFTDVQIIAALKETHGMIFLAAQKLGADPSTIHRRTHASAKVKAAVDSHRGELIDVAEVALMAAVQAKQPWAIAFTLKTIGKGRGYVERTEQEHTGAGGGPITVKAFEYGTAVAQIAERSNGHSPASGEGEGYLDGPAVGENGNGREHSDGLRE